MAPRKPSQVELLTAAFQAPLPVVRRAIAVGLANPDKDHRSELIRALRKRMLVHVRTGLWTPEQIREQEEDDRAFKAAREVVKGIGGPSDDEIAASVRLLWQTPGYSRWLSPLIRTDNPKRVSRRQIDAILEVDDDAVKGRAFALLVPYGTFGNNAVAAAREIDDPTIRGQTLAVMSASIDDSAMEAAAKAAQDIPDSDPRVTAISAIYSNATGKTKKHLTRQLLRAYDPETLERITRIELQPYVPSAGAAPPGKVKTKFAELRSRFAPIDLKRYERLLGTAPGVMVVQAEGFGEVGVATERPKRMKTRAIGAATSTHSNLAHGARSAERVVNLAFVRMKGSGAPIDKMEPLRHLDVYDLCVDLGAPRDHSFVRNPAPITPGVDVPAGTRFDVAVFPLSEQMTDAPWVDQRGVFEIQADGSARVVQAAGDWQKLEGNERDTVLRFRLTTSQIGWATTRCNVYCRGNLLQSHRISALVEQDASGPRSSEAQYSEIDYTVSPSLAAAHVSALRPQRLSVMLNSDDKGTHKFMFFGGDEKDLGAPRFQRECSLSGHQLQVLTRTGREALRRAAWSTSQAWTNETYRYADPRPDPGRCDADLIAMAKAGYRIWVDLKNRLAGDPDSAQRLADLMRAPGSVEIALKERPEHVFPASLLYDLPFDAEAPTPRLCPEYLRTRSKVRLHESRCFTDGCPHAADLTIVCPSGFWGYRHTIGLPVSTRSGHDAPPLIRLPRIPNGGMFTVLVSTDGSLRQRDAHVTRVKDIGDPASFQQVAGRKASFERLKSAKQHLVYFYGHGGVDYPDNDTEAVGTPFLQVGAAGEKLAASNLVGQSVRWSEPQPLVFLNGCNTAALEPETAYGLVSGFVEECAAAGVIGTEITIFEPLAVSFAEECLRLFFNEGIAIGEAVRRTRLKLLEEFNPLGLAYVPYVHSGLRVTT